MKKFRDLKIPVDNIVQDWNYWKLDSWGSHEFEAARYPNPQAMLDSVHAMNGRFMISVWPKFYDTVKNYKELDSKGWMYHQAIKDDIHDWLGFRGSFYDAYDAGARKTSCGCDGLVERGMNVTGARVDKHPSQRKRKIGAYPVARGLYRHR